MPAARFEISKDKAGKYRFHLRAGNGQIEAIRKAAAAEVVDLTEEAATPKK
jgi:hypothetical protein